MQQPSLSQLKFSLQLAPGASGRSKVGVFADIFFLRFYSLIYSRSLQSRYLTWCFASNTLTDEQGRVYHSLFSLLSLMTFYTKPQSDHPSLSKHDQVTAIAFLAQRPPNSHTLGADLAVSGVFTYPTFSPNTSQLIPSALLVCSGLTVLLKYIVVAFQL